MREKNLSKMMLCLKFWEVIETSFLQKTTLFFKTLKENIVHIMIVACRLSVINIIL